MPASLAPQAVLPRLDTIDVLRGLSIAAVVLLHTRIAFAYASPPAAVQLGDGLPRWLAYLLFNNGGNGVTVFFAISGFLITLTSLRRFGSLARVQPATFYRIRFARIAPLLLLLLTVLSLLHLAHVSGFRLRSQQATLPRALLAALTFHLNWLEATRGYLPANWDVLWSLSIEEMFYLFFPLACAGLLRLRRGMPLIIAGLLGFVAMAPFAKTVWAASPIAQEKSYLGGVGGIALGCLCALLTMRLATHRPLQAADGSRLRGSLALSARSPGRRAGRSLLLLQLLGSALILFVAVWPWSPLPFVRMLRHGLGVSATDDTLLALASCLIMLASALRGRAGSRLTAPLRWCGRHSYEIYLTHEFVVLAGVALSSRFHLPIPVLVAAILGGSALLGALLAWGFAVPLNRLLRGAPLPFEPAALLTRAL